MYHDYTISFGFLLPTSVFFFFFWMQYSKNNTAHISLAIPTTSTPLPSEISYKQHNGH